MTDSSHDSLPALRINEPNGRDLGVTVVIARDPTDGLSDAFATELAESGVLVAELPAPDPDDATTATADVLADAMRIMLARDDVDPSRVAVIGDGRGALTAIAYTQLGITTHALILLNPIEIPREEAPSALAALESYERPVLILNGAGLGEGPNSELYADAVVRAGRHVEHLLLPRTEAAMNDDAQRRATLDRLIEFVKSSPANQPLQ